MILTILCLSLRRILFREIEFERLELLITVKVTFEMLKEYDFLVYRLWVVEEIKLIDLVGQAFRGLSVVIHDGLLLGALNVVKVELVGVQDDLGAVIEEHSIRAVGEHVTESVLRREVNELGHKFRAWLAITLLDE